MDIGKRIRTLRQNRNLTLRELDKRTGIKYSYIQQLETGKLDPNLRHLEKIADALNVYVSAFFGDLQDVAELRNYVDWIALCKEFEGDSLTPEEVKQIVEFAKLMREKRTERQ